MLKLIKKSKPCCHFQGQSEAPRPKLRGGALRNFKLTLSNRFRPKKRSSIFDSLPMEETLLTPLEQIHFIIGNGILKPSLR